MLKEDEEKMAFILERDLYYYKMMPLGLKNTSATYQYLINKVLKDQFGQNMKVYINDM